MKKNKRKKVSSDPYEQYDDPYTDPYTDAYDDTAHTDDSDNVSVSKKKKKKGKHGKGSKGGGNIAGTLVAIVLVVVIIAGVLAGVGAVIGPTRGQCKDTIDETEYALNSMDASAFCDVINPVIGRKVKALLLVASTLTADDTANYIENAVDQLGDSILPEGSNASEVLESIEIEPYSYGLPGKTRKVKCKLNLNGDTYAKVTVYMKKSDGDVYISKITSIN